MNPATKVSTVLIVTLSFLCLVEGLICNVCEFAENSKCKKGKDRCVADHGQSCASISYYFGDIHLFSRQLCMPNCTEDNYTRNDKHYLMCCNTNLCNTF
ncbi:prostate and testis expressed protein 4 [Arvicola amphibius]|uniref:prostate and testis expressed protein 4 n=1 Tax=Arvicola amphibius TaxID=1047088 RepID=UPI0018E355D2|nr:prostate and testis expressed protein 4 [Arvicola amphibius]